MTAAEPAAPDLTLVHLERSRSDRIAWDVTAADIVMGFPVTTDRRFRPMDLAPDPAPPARVARITARPAFRKAVAP